MIPHYQTKWGKETGNCFQYALASILELEPNVVPDFCNEYEDEWYEELVKWLNQYGLSCISLEIRNKKLDDYNLKDCVLLACVENDDNINHAVIYKNGKIIHDPNFWYNGKYKVKTIDLIFSINPAEAIKNRKRARE